MTLILMLATFAVLTFLGLSCRRARLDLEEQICDCLHPAVPAAVGVGLTTAAGAAALTMSVTAFSLGRRWPLILLESCSTRALLLLLLWWAIAKFDPLMPV